MFINDQNMTCWGPDRDDLFNLDDDFRMEILEVADKLAGYPKELFLENDVVRMYCGL